MRCICNSHCFNIPSKGVGSAGLAAGAVVPFAGWGPWQKPEEQLARKSVAAHIQRLAIVVDPLNSA